ncbi:MAG TPA: serine protease [Bacteroidales bacterium]|nr:serine protease [Bacteroidales bacterium]
MAFAKKLSLPVFLTFVLFFLLILMIAGCHSLSVKKTPATPDENSYQSKWPFAFLSDKLNKVAGSVKKIYCIVEYEIFYFSESDLLTEEKLKQLDLTKSNAVKSSFNETDFGTATVLQINRYGMILLTCAHIVSNPDTIVSFFSSGSGQSIIESVAVKKTQMNYLRANDHKNNLLRILVTDNKNDLAFMCSNTPDDVCEMPVFNQVTGDANDLEWGTPVYLFGYPGGYQMFTTAVVGNPNPTTSGDFIVDATFNPGGSGSVVLVANTVTHDIDFVGIVRSASGTFSNIVKPEKESHQEVYNPNLPYTGELYVKRVRNLNYGVTFVTSVNSIRDFYFHHRQLITSEGYNLDNFFGI